jgi:protein kinase
MDRYTPIDTVGNGAFGIVTKCVERETGQLVAIKKMKERYRSMDQCVDLKEVKSLRKIGAIGHENVVKLRTIFRENDFLYLVFELCGDSLLTVIKSHPEGLPELVIRDILIQLLRGLAFVHQQGFFHRDMKPENVLFSGDTLKIVDFGLAREIRSRPPYTQYAGTRWYRAPEVLMRHQFYNSPVDIWAVGAIAAELFTMRPLFQGVSETDQIYKICGVLGPPSPTNWPEGLKLTTRLGLRFTNTCPIGLAAAIPNASRAAIEFIGQLLTMDPTRRPSAKKALTLPFLQGDTLRLSEIGTKKVVRRLPPPPPIDVNIQRPRAAPVSPSPTGQLRRSFSHESLAKLFKTAENKVDPRRPIDYRLFDGGTQLSDDIFDGL